MSLLYTLLPHRLPVDGRYGIFAGPVAPEEIPVYLPKGGLVAVRPHPRDGWQDIAGAIEAAGRSVVNASLVLWPDCVGRRRAVGIASRARLLGVRAVVWDAEPPVEALRSELTDPIDWPEAAVLWLRRRGLDLSPEAVYLVGALAAHAPGYRTLAGLAAAHGPAEGRWRRVFARAGLGHPGPWHAALRAVGMGTSIQREPTVRISEFAHRFGFSGPGALSDRIHDVIGARPRFIRCHIGTAWMLADATKRLNIL